MSNSIIFPLKNQENLALELAKEDLVRSGVNEQTIEAMAIIPIGNDPLSKTKLEEALGYYPFGRDSTFGYLIPYKNSIEDNFARLKILNPADGEPKYLAPKSEHTRYTQHLYMLDKDWEYRQKNKADIFVTEGEKKAAKLSQELHRLDTEDKKHIVIGLPGVTMWREAPEWSEINLVNKTVYIVFDADYTVNPDIAREGLKLAVFLKITKEVRDIKVITWDKNRGKGIDDYLVYLEQIKGSLTTLHLQGLLENATNLKPYLDVLTTKKAVQYIAETYYSAILSNSLRGGIKPKDIKVQIKDIVSLLAQDNLTVREIIQDIREQVLFYLRGDKIPKGYFVRDGWLYKDSGEKISPYFWIKQFVYYPEEKITNMVISYYKRKDEIKEFIISTNVSDSRKLAEFFSNNVGVAIDYGTAKDISRFLAEYNKKNESQIRTIEAVTRTGWYKDSYLLPTLDSCNYIIDNSILADSLALSDSNQEGLLLRQKNKLQEVLRTKAGLSCLGALFAPLVKICNTPNFFLNLSGLPGVGKTTAHRFAMSLFGDPDKLMVTLNTTQVGAERLANTFRDFPLWLDELETVIRDNKRSINHLINIVYNYTQGKGRTRSNKTLNIKPTAIYRGIVLTSMEQDIDNIVNTQSYSKPTGLCRRVLEVNTTSPDDLFSPLDTKTADIKDIKRFLGELNLFASKNYGAIGKKWIEYVLKNKEILKADYRKNFDNYFTHINIGGLEQFLCGLYTVAQRLQAVFLIDTALIQSYIKDLTQETERVYQASVITKDKIISDLKVYIQLNIEHFIKKENGTIIGVFDLSDRVRSIWGELNTEEHGNETVYKIKILTPKFREFCNQYGYSPKSILKELDKKGILHRNRNKLTSIIKLPTSPAEKGNTVSGYHFIFKEDKDGNVSKAE